MLKTYTLSVFLLVAAFCSAQCDDPTAGKRLNINNVNALIQNGQSAWNDDLSQGYMVPAADSISSMYAGGFWMGGVSPDGQLKMAGVQFGNNGHDFYPGPLSEGAAEVSQETCALYNDIWVLYRLDAEIHVAYHDCLNDAGCDVSVEFPNGYTMPYEYNTYPAHGDVALGQAFNLAPFFDYDGDGIYQPESGDCPLFDVMFQEGCQSCDALHGDMCLFWIDNDKGGLHLETQGEPIGIEIHNQAYAFASNGVLDNTTFYTKKIINRGTQTLSDTYTAIWADGDLGYSNDDYVGSDIDRNMGYFYNGDSFDEDAFGTAGYGENPPAIGIDLLRGPYQDADGVDNDEDGVVDNETLGMTNFMYYLNSTGIQGEPDEAIEFYNYMKSYWLNGAHLICGEAGIDVNQDTQLIIDTDWAFSGDSSDLDPCDDWTESTAGNPAGDRRGIVASGPFTIEPGSEHCIEYAVIWARPDPLLDLNAVQTLQLSSDSIAIFYDGCFACVPPGVSIVTEQIDAFTYSFANYGTGSIMEWNFGDGTTSTEEFPNHIFNGEGEFEITLTVSSECGITTDSIILFSVATSTPDIDPLVFSIGPNPVVNALTISSVENILATVKLINILGQTVLDEPIPSNGTVDLSDVASGQYIIHITENNSARQWTEKLIKL
jgi:hypothetical protein